MPTRMNFLTSRVSLGPNVTINSPPVSPFFVSFSATNPREANDFNAASAKREALKEEEKEKESSGLTVGLQLL